MFPSNIRQFENATVGEEIGIGAYGTVYNVILEDNVDGFTGKEVAGKELNCDLCVKDDWVKIQFFKECKAIADLKHPNVVQMYGLLVRPNAKLPMLIMEKMGTSLHAWLMNRNKPMKDEQKIRVMKDVVEGLAYIHSKNLVHRDLTANNILISSNQHELESGVLAKIADFGMAKIIPIIGRNKTHTACPGTPCYMPPEATVPKPNYNSSLDVYSFGVLLVFMLTGNLPTANPRRSLKEIQDHPDAYVRRHIQLVERCLAKQPEFRPTCEVIQNTLTGNGGGIERYSWECGNGYTPGLNIKGVCREKKCIRHEEDVICDMDIPFDHFDLATHAPDIKCPNCGSHVDPDTLIFYQCKWEVKGKWWESFSKPAENYSNEGEAIVSETKQFPIHTEGGRWLKLTIDVERYPHNIR